MKKISVLPAEAEPRLRRRSPQASHGLFYKPRWMPRFSLEKVALAASVLTEQFGEIVQVRVRMPSEAHTVGCAKCAQGAPPSPPRLLHVVHTVVCQSRLWLRRCSAAVG
jgi:hypothetical protein